MWVNARAGHLDRSLCWEGFCVVRAWLSYWPVRAYFLFLLLMGYLILRGPRGLERVLHTHNVKGELNARGTAERQS